MVTKLPQSSDRAGSSAPEKLFEAGTKVILVAENWLFCCGNQQKLAKKNCQGKQSQKKRKKNPTKTKQKIKQLFKLGMQNETVLSISLSSGRMEKIT